MSKQGVLRCNRGITVLEVVVLLVIAAVLAAILFPIIAPHGQPSRKMECMNNLHECATALQLYWQDHDSTLPSSALVRHSRTWNPDDFLVFATTKSASRGRLLSWGAALGKYVRRRDYGDRRVCPSDANAYGNAGSYVSYWWKLAIDRAWYGAGCKEPCRNISDFRYGADQIVLYERAGFHDNHPDGLGNNTRINVAFLDTHVRNVTLVNCAKGLITDPTSLGEPMYFNFDQSKPKGPNNPPPADTPANHTDPSRYSDWLP